MSRADDEERIWFASGLKFDCLQCGSCCGGEPGFIWVNDQEIEALARVVDTDVPAFVAQYTCMAHRGRSLKEQTNGDCIFFETGRGCTVYDARPTQCRTWPFWETNVASYEAWTDVCAACPGAGRGRCHSAGEVRTLVAKIRL